MGQIVRREIVSDWELMEEKVFMKDAAAFTVVAIITLCLFASILGCEDQARERSMARARIAVPNFDYGNEYFQPEKGTSSLGTPNGFIQVGRIPHRI